MEDLQRVHAAEEREEFPRTTAVTDRRLLGGGLEVASRHVVAMVSVGKRVTRFPGRTGDITQGRGELVLEYTGIRVRDLERSRKFYVEGLGLRSAGNGRMAAGGQWEELKDPQSGAVLELNFYPDDPPYREGDELDHLGFRVP